VKGRHQADEGSASLLVVAVVAFVTALTFSALSLAEVRIARHRAAAAADLAAVAGAAAWPALPSAMCARAREVGTLNGADVTGCRPDGNAVSVHVTVGVRGALPRGAVVSARARAARDAVPPLVALATEATRADRSVPRAPLEQSPQAIPALSVGRSPVMRMAAP
jgi:secretion/DNA translocation related TadE-like protein